VREARDVEKKMDGPFFDLPIYPPGSNFKGAVTSASAELSDSSQRQREERAREAKRFTLFVPCELAALT